MFSFGTRFDNCTSSVAQFHCHASALPAMMMPLAGVSQDQQAMYYLLQLAELATHLPVDACWVVVGVCPVPDPGLHSNSECLAQYGANRRVAVMVPNAVPEILEEKLYGAVAVLGCGDPSPMVFVKHLTVGVHMQGPVQIDAVFRDEQHLESSYQTTLMKYVLEHNKTLIEGDAVLFVPKYADSRDNPARRLITRLQRRAIKYLPGCAWVYSEKPCPSVQVHVADFLCFRQYVQVSTAW